MEKISYINLQWSDLALIMQLALIGAKKLDEHQVDELIKKVLKLAYGSNEELLIMELPF